MKLPPPGHRVTYITVAGPSKLLCTPEIYAFGEQLGEALVDHGYGVVCGGLFGLMEAVSKGAKASKATFWGATVGILPGESISDANQYCDIVIPTGLGFTRNALVARTGQALVAVGGGVGTLSEIAFAWQFGKPVCGITGLGGYSQEFAGRQLDIRQDQPMAAATSAMQVLDWLGTLGLASR